MIKGQGELSSNEQFIAKRSLLKAESNNFPGSAIYSANVQNLYKKKYEDDIIVASSSIPFYNANSLNATSRSVEFSGTFVGSEFEILLLEIMVSTQEMHYITHLKKLKKLALIDKPEYRLLKQFLAVLFLMVMMVEKVYIL